MAPPVFGGSYSPVPYGPPVMEDGRRFPDELRRPRPDPRIATSLAVAVVALVVAVAALVIGLVALVQG